MGEPASAFQTIQASSVVWARRGMRRHIRWSAYLFILPAFVIISMFHILPVFYALMTLPISMALGLFFAYLLYQGVRGQAFDWLQYGRTEPTIAAWNPIRGFIADAMTAVANGKATPEAALKDAAQKANAAIAGQ